LRSGQFTGALQSLTAAGANRASNMESEKIMCGLCRFWKRGASADQARGGPAEPGEAYGDALLAGWVSPPEGADPAPWTEPPHEQPDDAVLERFYRNQS
jgi:hypothetical protein